MKAGPSWPPSMHPCAILINNEKTLTGITIRLKSREHRGTDGEASPGPVIILSALLLTDDQP